MNKYLKNHFKKLNRLKDIVYIFILEMIRVTNEIEDTLNVRKELKRGKTMTGLKTYFINVRFLKSRWGIIKTGVIYLE